MLANTPQPGTVSSGGKAFTGWQGFNSSNWLTTQYLFLAGCWFPNQAHWKSTVEKLIAAFKSSVQLLERRRVSLRG